MYCVTPRQRAVFARVGLELASVHGDLAQLELAHLARQQQHLHEQLFQLRAEAAAGLVIS